jgi:hypothetical protein
MAANLSIQEESSCVNPLHLKNTLRDAYKAIQYREATTGYCYADMPYLAGIFGVSLSQAYRIVNQLKTRNLVEIVREPGQRTLLRTLAPISDENAKEMRKPCEGNAKAKPSHEGRARTYTRKSPNSEYLNSKDSLVCELEKKDIQQSHPAQQPSASLYEQKEKNNGRSHLQETNRTPIEGYAQLHGTGFAAQISPSPIVETRRSDTGRRRQTKVSSSLEPRVDTLRVDTVQPRANHGFIRKVINLETEVSAVMPQSVEVEFHAEKCGLCNLECLQRGCTPGNEASTTPMQTPPPGGTIAQDEDDKAGGYSLREERVEGNDTDRSPGKQREHSPGGNGRDRRGTNQYRNASSGNGGDAFRNASEMDRRQLGAGNAMDRGNTDEIGVQLLTAEGVEIAQARLLGQQKSLLEIQRAIAYLRQRIAQGVRIENPGAWLAESLRKNWGMKLLDASPEAIAKRHEKVRLRTDQETALYRAEIEAQAWTVNPFEFMRRELPPVGEGVGV